MHCYAPNGDLLGKILVPRGSTTSASAAEEEPAVYLRHDEFLRGADACERGAETVAAKLARH